MSMISVRVKELKAIKERLETDKELDILQISKFWAKDIENAIGIIETLSAKLQNQNLHDGWIPFDEENIPPTNEKVLVQCKEKVRYSAKEEKYRYYKCLAIYIPEKTIKSSDMWTDYDEICEEYDEETDESYVKCGWYEVIENWDDYSHVIIRGDIIAWQPLPESYKPKEETEDEIN